MTSTMDPNWGVYANRPPTPLGATLTDDGTLTGSPDLNGDYSVTPKDFFFEIPPGFNFHMSAVYAKLCMKKDASKTEYADISGGLANGIQFAVRRSGVTTSLGSPIKSNRDWAFVSTEVKRAGFEAGTQADVWNFSTDILEVFGVADVFYGDNSDRYLVTLQDDLSSIECHRIYVFGTVFKIAR